jgi:beta-glucanase (GH16 family)
MSKAITIMLEPKWYASWLAARGKSASPSCFASVTFAILILVLSYPVSAEPVGSCELYPVLMEDFDDESIASHKIGPARWTAHTPWSGDFGDAKFGDPGPGGPFKVESGVLAITASKTPDGRWSSGLIAAADASGAGFGTRYGYFEVRMKMPPGRGTWPAFWLAMLKPAHVGDGNVEIDVVEYYGQFPSAYHAVMHVWYKDRSKSRGKDRTIEVPGGALVAEYHTYGVDLSPQAIVFFLDGKQVWSQPTPQELDGPMYPLVNLALGSGWPIDQTPNPSTLLVDYVHVHGRDAGPPEGCPPGLRPELR